MTALPGFPASPLGFSTFSKPPQRRLSVFDTVVSTLITSEVTTRSDRVTENVSSGSVPSGGPAEGRGWLR
jgi:hypothetical protein